MNLLASEVAADYFQVCLPTPHHPLHTNSHLFLSTSHRNVPLQPAAASDPLSSLSSAAAPFTRPSATSAAGASSAASGAGLLQAPHTQATSSAVWTPLHTNPSGGLFQVFAAAPNGASAVPGESFRVVGAYFVPQVIRGMLYATDELHQAGAMLQET